MSGRAERADGGRRIAPWRTDAWSLAAVGLVLRLGMVGWATGHIPPTADGEYYQVVATRIAAGQGYTWLWPDGVVTYAAHYPVGYPAVIGALYAALGVAPLWAMVFNALLGAGAVAAVHQIAASVATRRGALVAGVAAAVHPALVAYTPAMMTEGVVAALLALAGWVVVMARAGRGRSRWGALVGLGLLLGFATLVRPQVLIVSPLFGLIAWGRPKGGQGWQALGGAALVGGIVVATCLPWTVRNCFMMNAVEPGTFDSKSCSFVSANGGWNLLIGSAPGATGSWIPIEQAPIPDDCREVYAEAGKDRCFGRAAIRHIRQRPGHWLGLMPRKLAATFNACGAAAWYLHAANAVRFPDGARWRLDAVEVVFQRLLLLICFVSLWRARPRAPVPNVQQSSAVRDPHAPRDRSSEDLRSRMTGALSCVLAPLRKPKRCSRGGAWFSGAELGLAIVLLVGAGFAVQEDGWVAYLALLVGALLLRGRLVDHPPAALAAACVAATAATHALFFGAGRYSLVCYALLAALAGACWPAPGGQERREPNRL